MAVSMLRESHISRHTRLVGKIGLAVGITACVVLGVTLALITHPSGESYGTLIRAHALTRQYLGPAMLVAGLILVAIIGFITWLIALYTSFRVAGPLYRFSRNLELATRIGPVSLTNLREGDDLQTEGRLVEEAVTSVRAHYATLREAAEAAERALLADDAEAWANAVRQLKDHESRIRF